MSLIHVHNLNFAYDGSYDPIFENVSFQIDTDWRLGFTGRNGRGKTTFLQLLRGKYEYSGSISASVQFDYFPYAVENADDFTLELIQGIAPNAEPWQILKELSLLDVAEDALYRPFSSLSDGEQTKALIAALFMRENRFLLIDEPTNHLDMAARKKLAQYLNRKKGFILVSHDRAFLDSCIDHILVIQKTKITVQKGNFSSWWQNKELEDRFELAENEKLKKDIRRLSIAAQTTATWSDKVEAGKFGNRINSGSKPDRGYIGHKAEKMMQRSKAIKQRQENLLNEKAMLLKNVESSRALAVFPLDFHSDRLLDVENLSLFYGNRQVCRNISFSIDKGERVVLQGKNGCGKTSLLRLICGEDIAHTGKVIRNQQLRISYVSQRTDCLRGSLSDYAAACGIDESLLKAMLRNLDFSRAQFDKPMETFSSGQKKKVLLAKSICQRAHLYIWDEPLNYIDVISRIQLENMLLQYPITLLFVEHDSAFVHKIATRTIDLSGCF